MVEVSTGLPSSFLAHDQGILGKVEYSQAELYP